MEIIAVLAQELGIKKQQAEAAVRLIDEGNTIPFIARYRKEATGALNDAYFIIHAPSEKIKKHSCYLSCKNEKSAAPHSYFPACML